MMKKIFRFFSNFQNEMTLTAGIAKTFVTKDENDLSPNELINSDQKKTRSISNMYFWFRFLSCGCYFSLLLITVYRLRCGFEKKLNGERKRKKVNSKTAKQFIGNWVFWWPVDENGKTAFNSLNFLYPTSTPTHRKKNIHLIFYFGSNG